MSDVEKKKFAMTAVVFRNIFFGLFALLFILAVVFAVFGASRLQKTANEVKTVVNAANTLEQSNNRTLKLWDELQENQKTATKAQQVVAESKKYAYQDVIIRDLKNFAVEAGITVINYDFTISQAAPSSPSAPSSNAEGGDVPAPMIDSEASPDEPGGVSGALPGASPGAAAPALKSTSVSITVKEPVSYRRLMTFINYIEQNLTKMQISKISLSRNTEKGSGLINSDSLIIEVYIR